MSELTRRAKGQSASPSAQAAAGAGEPSPQAAAESVDLPPLTEVSADDAVVRRTKEGWRVGDVDVPDLTSAMVLADLISAELAAPEAAVQPAAATAGSTGEGTQPANSPAPAGNASDSGPQGDAASSQTPATSVASAAAAQNGGGTGKTGKGKVKGKSGRSKEPAPSESSKLRATIGQLEHALTARIRVEQAIGVLAERHRIQPRQAFEQLRSAARSRGRRVIDIASDVVASATNPLLQLPDELSRPRAGGRQARRSRQTPTILGSE